MQDDLCPTCHLRHGRLHYYREWLQLYGARPALAEQAGRWRAVIDYHEGDRDAWRKLRLSKKRAGRANSQASESTDATDPSIDTML